MDARRTRWALVLATAVAPATWGTTYLVTTEHLPADRPLLAGAVRALPAGIALTMAARSLPHGAWWGKAAVLGVLNIGAFFALLFVAAYRLPGGVAAVLGAVQPLVVAVLGVGLLGERLRPRPIVLGLVGVAGVALIVLSASAALDPVGVMAGVLGTASMAAGVVLTKRWGRPAGVVAFTGWQLTAGGLALVPLILVVEGVPASVTAGNVGGFAYLAVVGTALAYVLWLRGIALLPVQDVSFLGLLSPVVAAVAGWVVLEQVLTAGQILGAALALSALVLAQRGPGRTPGMPRCPTTAAPRVSP
jgi:probable blue pigment (indigoidine) exporter